ncbi:hypothetical protein [Nitratifractor sp.]|uniref:hypothetical protein n=1 Tax=Nitratifractor sp. TaxID=2268144 RepID=UPI0025E5AD94|nr:hypothetical protein [Nitratifractor sp.]
MILYGTKVHSDLPFPLHLPATGDTRYEIDLRQGLPEDIRGEIRCGSFLYTTHGRRVFLYSDRLLEEPIPGQPYCYEAERIVRFSWRHGERTVRYELLEEGNADLLAFWFIHLFQPLYMTFEGLSVFFHSGAVEIEGAAIAFIAPSTGGKSTMTHCFLTHGHSLITDDILPIWLDGDHVVCAPSFPYYRPFRAPETLGYFTDNYTTDFRPLQALYVLEKGDADTPTVIDALQGYRKFEALKKSGLVYTFDFMTLSHNRILSSLLNYVKVFRVTRPWDMSRLDEVYREIQGHAASCKCTDGIKTNGP